MAKLPEETLDMIDDQVDFSQVFRMSDLIFEVRSLLSIEMAENLDQLAKKLEQITEGQGDDEEEVIFDLADELMGDILAAQEHLEDICVVLSSISECNPELDNDVDEWDS